MQPEARGGSGCILEGLQATATVPAKALDSIRAICQESPYARRESFDMMAKKPKFVAYIRLSKKDETGAYLGMDGQLKDCRDFAQQRGGEIIGEPYKEVETGADDNRPELAKALRHCRKTGATLLVAKLDRLSRSVRFLAELRDCGVPLAAANIPDSNTLTFTVMSGLGPTRTRDH